MDDLYDDLENYNEVNSLQELRSENQNLKQKLGDCTLAMGKLQKDYDHLAMEFKKLEMNYSSLLKTARAEIERKTQIINNLNIEKDMMVLNAIKNGSNIRRNFRGNPNINKVDRQDSKKVNEEKQKTNVDNSGRKEKSEKGQNTNWKESFENFKREIETDETLNKLEKVEKSVEKKRESKENLTANSDGIKAHASSIKNRRKSMSCISVQDKLIPVEESEKKIDRCTTTKETVKHDVPTVELCERNKFHADRNSNKTSETSSINTDRSSNYYESSRETNGRQSRHYDSEKYRSRNKYEFSQKHRRHYSPDRPHRRGARDYQEGYYHRIEHGRNRVLESPPPDPNYPHHKRGRDYRPTHDRYSNDKDRYRFRPEERHAQKHKMSDNSEEPSSKRQKIESFNIPAHAEPFKDKRHYVRESDQLPAFDAFELEALHETCQSPDYTQIESAYAPVREIRNTALTPLEDPRLSSDKYLLKTNSHGETTLATMLGRDVDIIPIDKSEWKIQQVNIPRALRCQPTKFSDDIIKDIYMDIDNPTSDFSAQSEHCYDEEDAFEIEKDFRSKEINKEIQFDMNMHTIQEIKEDSGKTENDNKQSGANNKNASENGKQAHENQKQPHDMENHAKENDKCTLKTNVKQSFDMNKNASEKKYIGHNKRREEKEKQNYKINDHDTKIIIDNIRNEDDHQKGSCDMKEHATEKIIKTETKVTNLQCSSTKHRIPKINHNTENTQQEGMNIDADKLNYHNIERHEGRGDKRTRNTSPTRLNDVNNKFFYDKSNGINEVLSKSKNDNQNEMTRGIVEGDLELSDETSDNIELSRPISIEKTVQRTKTPLVDEIHLGDYCSSSKISNDSNKDINIIEKPVKDVKTKDLHVKKEKTKKKKNKYKDQKEAVDSAADVVQPTEKKTRSKKDKDNKPKEIKNKFSDLFGDSESLITPDDLGIGTYVPMFEDAQDAVDINLKPIPEKQPDEGESNLNNETNSTKIDSISERHGNDNQNDHKEIAIKDVDPAPEGMDNKIKESLEGNEGKGNVEVITNVVYTNLDSETNAMNSDVVKTVIISTGVQPKFPVEDIEMAVEKPSIENVVNLSENVDRCPIQSVLPLKTQYMTALATSTPNKEFPPTNTIETNVQTVDTSCNSNDSRLESIGAIEKNNTNKEVSQNTDIPDVRIFVKRRRRIVKKQPT